MTFKRLGQQIRDRRKELELTLSEVAQATGLSVGFLSQLERNLTAPSLSSLTVVAKVLKTSVGDLVGRPVSPRADTHHETRQPYSVDGGGVKYERLSTVFRGSVLHSVKFTMPSGYKSEKVSHPGEEMVFVIHGRIRYEVDEESFLLEQGDSLHFDAKIPHSIEALSHESGCAEVIWTGTLDVFDGADRQGSDGRKIEMQGTEFNALIETET
jgi:transcriptional regulator with XRE-family HTH domain